MFAEFALPGCIGLRSERDEGQIISLVAPPNLRVEKVGQVKLDEAS